MPYHGITELRTGKWRAQLWYQGKTVTFGSSYESQIEAALAYDDGASALMGARANLNFPGGKGSAAAAAAAATAAAAAKKRGAAKGTSGGQGEGQAERLADIQAETRDEGRHKGGDDDGEGEGSSYNTWWTSGSDHVGKKIYRTVLDDNGLIMEQIEGTITGWLDASASEFLDDDGQPGE